MSSCNILIMMNIEQKVLKLYSMFNLNRLLKLQIKRNGDETT